MVDRAWLAARLFVVALPVAACSGSSDEARPAEDAADVDSSSSDVSDAPVTSETASETSSDAGTKCAVDDPANTSYPKIPSDFDVNSELVPAGGTGAIPPSGAPDVVGAFRFICNPSHLSYDDPIVYPGQPGKAHLHQFFGNTKADACSTYASLRTSGESTCNNKLNRSAYWVPAMMNGKGKVVRPDYVSVYYKRRPKTDPECQRVGKECVNLPRGLRFVFGYDSAKPTAPHGGWFNCDASNLPPGPERDSAVSDHFPDIPTAAKGCPLGARLGLVINAPDCWNGKDLDSPDHRSHVATGSYGSWGYYKCPDTHPYVIPTFTLGAWYTTDADLDRSGSWDASKKTWHLSSDMNADHSMKTPGSTVHSDWMGAWDDDVMQMWSDHCIDKMLNCSGGDLGNGKQLKMFSGFSWTASPRVVEIPPKP